MARIRSIKPEFCASEQITECSPNARLTFVLMWIFCDDYGVHPASPKRLKMEIYPADDISSTEIRSHIDELINNGLLIEYQVGNEVFWHVTGWEKHQKIDQRTGKYPLPNGEIGGKIRRTIAEQSPKVHLPFTPGVERSREEKNRIDKKENIKEKSLAALPSEPVPTPTPIVPKKQPDNEIELDFNIFYSAFPVKKGKEQAIKNFKKHYKKVKEVGLQFILDDIKWRISNDKQWLRDFIPHPGTYISESRWSDEPNARTGISQPTSSNPKTTTTPEVLKATIDHYNDNTLSPEEFVKRRLNG